MLKCSFPNCPITEETNPSGDTLVDFTVEVAQCKEGWAKVTQYVCDDHLTFLNEQLRALGFESHRHGSINFLEDLDSPPCTELGDCPLDPNGHVQEFRKRETLTPWANRKTGPVLEKRFNGTPIYYRERNGVVQEICLGERYAHVSPGYLFNNEGYRGSYTDNWHGGPSGSLSQMIEWIAEAEHPEYGYTLWMEKE